MFIYNAIKKTTNRVYNIIWLMYSVTNKFKLQKVCLYSSYKLAYASCRTKLTMLAVFDESLLYWSEIVTIANAVLTFASETTHVCLLSICPSYKYSRSHNQTNNNATSETHKRSINQTSKHSNHKTIKPSNNQSIK